MIHRCRGGLRLTLSTGQPDGGPNRRSSALAVMQPTPAIGHLLKSRGRSQEFLEEDLALAFPGCTTESKNIMQTVHRRDLMTDDNRQGREQLIQRERIRRGNETPAFVRDEKGGEKSYPYFLPDDAKSGTRLVYRKSRWSWIADTPDGVKRREVFGWIKAGQKRVGAIQLFEYDLAPAMDNDNFLDLMDAESSIECHLAEVLCASWDWFGDEVTDYGNLLDFRMAWMDRAFDCHGVWCAAASELIAREFPRYGLLTMKAFPLEYEGRVPSSLTRRSVWQKT
jgi:hypothetical protein